MLFQQTSTWGKFFEVWDVIGVGFNTVENHAKYLVLWKGYNYDESSWVEADDLQDNIAVGFSLEEFIIEMQIITKTGRNWNVIWDLFLDEIDDQLNPPQAPKKKRKVNNAHSMALSTTHIHQHQNPSKLAEYLKKNHSNRAEQSDDIQRESVVPQLPLPIPEQKKRKQSNVNSSINDHPAKM
jgi:hypothetical protein